MKWRALMCVLWPAFMMAGVGSAVVFALIDPLDVAIFGYIRPDREMLYAGGFFLFWFIASLSSLLSLYMYPREDDNNGHDIGF